MNYALEVEHLSKTYDQKVLNNIRFSIYEGCITGFIGINGSGKTTTIKSILGLITPDTGEIKVFGKPMKNNEREIKNRIGIIFDNGYLYEDLSLLDMKRVIAPAYSNWDDTVFKNYMDQFNLDVKKHVSTLSKGMRMKFALALALSHHADLLIMDEPTSGLDPLVRNQLLDIMRAFISEEGKSVFFSTHITTDLDKIADQIIMLHRGEIIFQQDKDSLIENHAMVQGNKDWLTEESKKLFVCTQERGFNFEGLTDKKNSVKKSMGKAVFAKPSIEDIMIGYIER